MLVAIQNTMVRRVARMRHMKAMSTKKRQAQAKWLKVSRIDSTGDARKNRSRSESPAKKAIMAVMHTKLSAVLRLGCMSTSTKGTANRKKGATRLRGRLRL